MWEYMLLVLGKNTFLCLHKDGYSLLILFILGFFISSRIFPQNKIVRATLSMI